jgi:hypothetical protein
VLPRGAASVGLPSTRPAAALVIALGALILVALCVLLAVQLDARKHGDRERARKRRY